ncbi:MAG: hypothetical protein K5873_01035 [Treponema sp.]|nr:hypothetical protein [Treponema sp.]
MKKIFFLFCGFLSAFFAFSQVSVDVTDRFYREAQIWELRGLTSTLPQIRPYPLNAVKKILNDVIENGSESESQLAKEEYERIFSRPWSLYGEGTLGFKASAQDYDNSSDTDTLTDFHGEMGVAGDVAFHRIFTLGYKAGIYGQTRDFSEYLPMYTNFMRDSRFDPVDVGPLETLFNVNMNVAIGNDCLYGTGGLSRLGYGPFHFDGLALNDGSFHSANFVLNATREKWSYASAYAIIGTTRNMGPSVDGDWLSDGKYFAFHTLKWHAFEKFQVSYYENIVFGPQTNLSYFTPVPYSVLQNIGGASDNLQMGLLFEVKPVKGLNWATDFFVDDIELNEVFKFNLDTKLRFGAQTGFIYAPEESILSLLSANYTAVMPYVYAHWEYDDDNSGSFTGKTWNYQNYTNAGVCMGSVLDPNSDKISLTASLQPLKDLSLNLFGNFIRHANSAEAFSDDEAAEYMLAKSGTYATDGSLYTSQMFSSSGSSGRHVDSAWKKLGFMTSDHKMYVAQLGFNAEYTFARTKYGAFSLSAGYTFEYVKNNGVNKNLYSGGLAYTDNGDGTYKIGESTYSSWEELKASSEVQAAVKAAKENWISNLYDSMNHYFSISMKYRY